MDSLGSRSSMALGAALGVALAAADVALLAAFGVTMTVSGRPAMTLVFVVFALTYAALGAVGAALWTTRRQLRREAADLRTANTALARAREELVRAETLAGLGRMAAGVAHEVRNPLGVMRSAASLLAEDAADDSEAARAASFIVEEVDRLDGFVRRVLDIARPASLERAPVDLAELARSVADRAGVEATGEGAVAEVDRDLLTTALLGLLDNARQAGATRVVVRTGAEGTWLEVADDGPGVPADLQPRLFEPFFTTRAGGTGLGLAMAARIARAHGGSLEYRDGAALGPGGRGACFHLALPRTP